MLLETADVARRFGLSPDRIRQMARAGALPFEVTPRGARLFNAQDVERILEARRRGGSSAVRPQSGHPHAGAGEMLS